MSAVLRAVVECSQSAEQQARGRGPIDDGRRIVTASRVVQSEPPAAPALQALVDAGYRLAVVSNNDGRLGAQLEGAGLLTCFCDRGLSQLADRQPRSQDLPRRPDDRNRFTPGGGHRLGEKPHESVTAARHPAG
jgi:hypothetical protein